MENDLAPIVLFVYNRLDHTKQTIDALKKNVLAPQSDLFIYSDAAARPEKEQDVKDVREYIATISGFNRVIVKEQKCNLGLANSIITGVTEIVNKYKRIIVLEDDLVTAPNFLSYMNDALDKYSVTPNVFSVSGYSYCPNVSDNTYFLTLTTSWGWATWADRWENFERDPEELKLYLNDKKNAYCFNYDGSYDFVKQKNLDTTWALYWYFSSVKREGLTLYPRVSMVQNIGYDGSGVHTVGTNDKPLEKFEYHLTDTICEELHNKKCVVAHFKKKRSVFGQLKKVFPMPVKRFVKSILIKAKLFFLKPRNIKDTFVDKSVHVLGWHNVNIGEGTAISEGCWLNVNNRNIDDIQISIGKHSYVGKRSFFSSGKKIQICDYFMGGINCNFLGSDHRINDPYKPYITTGITTDCEIYIGQNVWFGANVTVIGNVTVGNGSIVGANSLVTKDIPPFSIAVGSPAKVIKRYNFKEMKWVLLKDFDQELESYFPTEEEYIKELRKTKVVVPFQAASKSFGDIL